MGCGRGSSSACLCCNGLCACCAYRPCHCAQRAHTHTHTHARARAHTHTLLRVQWQWTKGIAHMRACTHACMHTCVHAHMHTCAHACMHTCMHAHMRACMHVHMHACVHACMRTCSSSTRGNPHCTSTQVRDVAFASISIWFCQSRSIFCLSQVKCRFIFYLSCPCIFQPVLSP